jgi:hypothetical protein
MVKTIYLEMFARQERVVPPPRDGLAVVHARNPFRFGFSAPRKGREKTPRLIIIKAPFSAT